MSDLRANVKAPFELILVDTNPALCAAWRTAFQAWERVSVVHGCFEQLSEFDLMVSPANSFGLMDGGIDAAIIRYFGDELAVRVQVRILAEFWGEQPVGTCLIVETGNKQHPFLAHTPTMRVPMVVTGTDNVYSAMRAMLLAAYKHNATQERQITKIACPGLGTGVGMMSPETAARQMAIAYKHFLEPPTHAEWRDAIDRHLRVTMPSHKPILPEIIPISC